MTIREVLEEALKKMPDSKELWLHPMDHAYVEYTDPGFIDSLNLKVKVSPQMLHGQFLLSEKDLDEELEKMLKSDPLENMRIQFYNP